jgi:tetratricopeptide (TPR) repeat protein
MEIYEATTFLILGQSQRELCHYKNALESMREAVRITEISHDALLGGYYVINLVEVYLLLGQPSLAKDSFDKAMLQMPEHPSARAKMFREQARWLIEQGPYEQARAVLEEGKQALAGGQRQVTLGLLHLLEALIIPPQESLQLAQQILEIAREGELKGGLALGALTRCAQACLKLKKNKVALEYSNEAIKMLTTYDPTNFYLGEIHLTHYQALKACKDKTAKDYLKQTLTWLINIADNHVPTEYRESFLNNNPVNKAILEAARLEGLLESKTSG